MKIKKITLFVIATLSLALASCSMEQTRSQHKNNRTESKLEFTNNHTMTTHHIILWKLKDELTDAQKAQVKKDIKEGLEGLAGKIPGLISIKVNTEGLPSSNVDLMLDSTFDSPESLKGYSVHPEHVAVANERVRPYTSGRYCLDFED